MRHAAGAAPRRSGERSRPSSVTEPSYGTRPATARSRRGLAGAVRADERRPTRRRRRSGRTSCDDRRAVAETAPVDGFEAVTRPPVRVVRSTRTKNGAPKNAVTTPIGSSAGATRCARRGRRAPGTRRRTAATAAGPRGSSPPASSRTACGTMMPTKPIRPLTATAAAVPSDAAATTSSRTAHGARPSVAASSSPTAQHVEDPPVGSSTTALTATYGRTSHDLVPAGAWRAGRAARSRPARIVVRVALQHEGLDRGEERGDRDAGQDQRRRCSVSADRAAEQRRCSTTGDQRADERRERTGSTAGARADAGRRSRWWRRGRRPRPRPSR